MWRIISEEAEAGTIVATRAKTWLGDPARALTISVRRIGPKQTQVDLVSLHAVPKRVGDEKPIPTVIRFFAELDKRLPSHSADVASTKAEQAAAAASAPYAR